MKIFLVLLFMCMNSCAFLKPNSSSFSQIKIGDSIEMVKDNVGEPHSISANKNSTRYIYKSCAFSKPAIFFIGLFTLGIGWTNCWSDQEYYITFKNNHVDSLDSSK